jgi:hypothetical protein
MTVTSGRVVITPGEVKPYKVVLGHSRANDSEHAVATVREGEAFIRSELPAGPAGAFAFGGPRETPFLPGAPLAEAVAEDARPPL